MVILLCFWFCFCLALTFQLLDKLWSRVSSLPPGTCHEFLSRIGFSIPAARRFPSNVANSRSRAFRESICITTAMYIRTSKQSAAIHETTHYELPGTRYDDTKGIHVRTYPTEIVSKPKTPTTGAI